MWTWQKGKGVYHRCRWYKWFTNCHSRVIRRFTDIYWSTCNVIISFIACRSKNRKIMGPVIICKVEIYLKLSTAQFQYLRFLTGSLLFHRHLSRKISRVYKKMWRKKTLDGGADDRDVPPWISVIGVNCVRAWWYCWKRKYSPSVNGVNSVNGVFLWWRCRGRRCIPCVKG